MPPRLRSDTHSPAWFDFATGLVRDLEPLGLKPVVGENSFDFEKHLPPDADGLDPERQWAVPHALRHQTLIENYQDEILAFERDFEPLFVDMQNFQPSAVRPVLQPIDFKNPEHRRVIDYLRWYQSVTPGWPVGRSMGLFIWDVGQAKRPLLFGAVVLASASFSQPIRDARLGWKKDVQKDRAGYDPVARAIRILGHDRIMQLTMACALPPYSLLSGAWLAALAPFTPVGLEAFRGSFKTYNPNADLAAVVTTTAMAVSGAPFRGHRVVQLAPKGVSGIANSSGNIYSRADVPAGVARLHAHFEDFVSDEIWTKAEALHMQEQPKRYANATNKRDCAMNFALKRCNMDRGIFQGNEMGVHFGALGADTLDYLKTGKPRPASARPLLDWNHVVDVWSRRLLPAPPSVGESALQGDKAEHRMGRQRRLDGARFFPADRIKLSSRLGQNNPADRVRLQDIMPVGKPD